MTSLEYHSGQDVPLSRMLPCAVYLTLHDASGVEIPPDGGYRRVLLSSEDIVSIGGGAYANGSDVWWPQATKDWRPIAYVYAWRADGARCDLAVTPCLLRFGDRPVLLKVCGQLFVNAGQLQFPAPRVAPALRRSNEPKAP